MIIDTHTHFYDPTRPQGVPWAREDNELLYRPVLPEHHRDLSEPEGVTGTVVVEASAWLEDNEWILNMAAEDPWIVGLVGHVDPNHAEFGSDIERLSANPLFLGIRVGGVQPKISLQGIGDTVSVLIVHHRLHEVGIVTPVQ